MEDTIKVTIKPEHFRDAPYGYNISPMFDPETHQFLGNAQCVLEVSLREVLGEGVISVGRYAVQTVEDQYLIPLKEWGDESGSFSPKIINALSKKAKESLDEIPTIEITLTKIPADFDN